MIKVALFIFFLVLISPLFADKPLLAVLPVKISGDEAKHLFTADDLGYMSDAIRAEASRQLGAQVQILSQLQIDKLVIANIQECSGAGCFAGFLKTISADFGLQPTVRFAAGKLRLTIEMASNESTLGMREYAQEYSEKGKNDLIEKSKNLSLELYQQLHGELGKNTAVSSGNQMSSSSVVVTESIVDKKDIVAIPAGCFLMGSSKGDLDEEPVHQVCLSAFHMDKYEITQGKYKKIIGENPSDFSNCGENCPVEQVSWIQANHYCESMGMRLPTEAEWEYAASEGANNKWYCGNEVSCLNQIAWYAGNSGMRTHPVGQMLPNKWGLYDMAGNVWEWTSDWYSSDAYNKSGHKDPKGAASSPNRVFRGGSWSVNPEDVRSANRGVAVPSYFKNTLGFRCAF